MGIPKFKPALGRALEGVKLYSPATRPSNALYLDANSIIHPAVGEGRTEAVKVEEYPGLVADVLAAFKSVVDYYGPRKLVYISVDGPPPMAKIQEQRERMYQDRLTKKENDYTGDLIKPGTPFMQLLDKEFRDKVASDNNVYGVEKLVYSSHLVPGEGEHKILAYIRANKREVESYYGSQVIYGNDSDLIILGLCAGINKLFIASNNATLLDSRGHVIKEAENNAELSIDNLRAGITQVIGPDKEQEFIFACSLLGNDFLPRSFVVSDVSEGLRVIVEHLKTGTAIEDNCLSLFQALADEEQLTITGTLANKILTRYEARSPDAEADFPSRILDAAILQEDMDDAFRYYWYNKFMLYVHEFNDNSLPVLARSCLEYIRGLFWVYNYYTRGQDSVTWLWYYPYHHSPLFSDLARTVVAVNEGIIKGGDSIFIDIEPYNNEMRFTALHQLVSVMPIQSYTQLPLDLYSFYTSTSPLAHFMPVTMYVNNELIEVDYQTRVIVPKIDYYSVAEALASRSFTSGVIARFANTRDVQAIKPLRRTEKREERREQPTERGRGGGRGGRGEPTPAPDISRYVRDLPPTTGRREEGTSSEARRGGVSQYTGPTRPIVRGRGGLSPSSRGGPAPGSRGAPRR